MPGSKSNEIIKLNEEYEDRLFKLVMDNAAEKNGRLIDKDIEKLNSDPENLPSQTDIIRFSQLLDMHLKKMEKIRKRHRGSRLISRIAVAVIIIMVVFSIMMLTVQAFRVQVLNFLISIEPKFTSLQLQGGDNAQKDGKLIVNWTNAYVPTYIPNGYEVSNISYSDSLKKIIFTGKNDNSTFITYTESESINSISIDTEGASLVEKVSINGNNGTLAVKDSTVTIGWTMDNRLFIIQAQINKDEAVKIAEGVKFVK
ncbi:MAG: DUF4367 domain-containing protein [Bacillota bacterium]|nr:DUF4367 domain-containing protein [Bacillota bacterium]